MLLWSLPYRFYKFGKLGGIIGPLYDIILFGLLEVFIILLFDGFLFRYDGFVRAGCCTDSYLEVDILLLSYLILFFRGGRTVRLSKLLYGVGPSKWLLFSTPIVPP